MATNTIRIGIKSAVTKEGAKLVPAKEIIRTVKAEYIGVPFTILDTVGDIWEAAPDSDGKATYVSVG
jgi:hypothetical protein